MDESENAEKSGKKRKKCLRDKAAPRPPLTGYIRFLNDRRDKFRAENPNMSFAEVTKVLATEWNQLHADKKQQYLSAAEQEREKYVKELEAYKKTDAHRNFIQRKLKKMKVRSPEKEDRELEKEKPSSDNGNTVFDIPIFSEEFLKFNKARESELRYLRKTLTDQGQAVSVLEKHVENLNIGIMKLTDNTNILKCGCNFYESHLNDLRSKFLDTFANIALPDNVEPPTIETVDEYVILLAKVLRTSTDPSLIATLKKTICKLDKIEF